MPPHPLPPRNVRLLERARFALLLVALLPAIPARAEELRLAGLSVTPHMKLDTMLYPGPSSPAEGARVEIFLRDERPFGDPQAISDKIPVRFAGRSPEELLESGDWAWHDTPSAEQDVVRELPPGGLLVWAFNGTRLPWGPGGEVPLRIGPASEGKDTETETAAPLLETTLSLEAPRRWISSIAFLAPEGAIHPDRLVVHVENGGESAFELMSYRIWPAVREGEVGSPSVFATPIEADGEIPAPPSFFDPSGVIPPAGKGGFEARLDGGRGERLRGGYCVIEVIGREVSEGRASSPVSLWARVRARVERFDISAGWAKPLTDEAYLKTLMRLHVNTAHLVESAGYTDTDLWERYPLKLFGRLEPFERFDRDEMLPRIHASEFLGEPQFGGGEDGKPVPPQKVWSRLRPYASTRLATTLTHSEERIWRDYAGLSDFPHYDAYRVSAPSPDFWLRYEWHGKRKIMWGSPLETIGDMCRSLRELNRPAPCAIWSQGPHEGWDVYGGRRRTSPTREEIRSQAWHALSTRITSLYWFNLSARSLVEFPDTIEELERVGREIRMLDEFLLEGDAHHARRILPAATADSGSGRIFGGPADGSSESTGWDLATVCGPRAALLFALDLDYRPDPEERVFQFGPPREATWSFPLPSWLENPGDVFRVDADGAHAVAWRSEGSGVEIRDARSCVGIYVATRDTGLRERIEAERKRLVEYEESFGFDPAREPADLERLRAAAKE